MWKIGPNWRSPPLRDHNRGKIDQISEKKYSGTNNRREKFLIAQNSWE